VPDAELAGRHDEFVSGDAWIVDGWGAARTLEPRLHQADLVILVEHPLRIHLWWVLKRAAKSIFRQDPHFNDGCPPRTLTSCCASAPLACSIG
jgi:adenylate kinase family enzyme